MLLKASGLKGFPDAFKGYLFPSFQKMIGEDSKHVS
jgi:hypothetical protein